jgi:putative spermidine/putrescine transport system permease protein
MKSARHRRLLLLLLPAAVLLTAFFFYPLVRVVGLSVSGPGAWWATYASFFSSAAYGNVMFRTFGVSLSVTVCCLALGYPTAGFLAHAPRRWRNPLLLLVILPYLTSLLVRTYSWVVLLNDQGPINRLLMAIGLIGDPAPLLYSRFGMLVGMIHILLPMMVLPIYAAMLRTDSKQVWAAMSLGAGPVRTFSKIYLPQTMPGVRSGCLLVFIVALGFYITPMALGGLGDVMLSNLIAQQISSAVNFPMAAVMALVLLFFTIVFCASTARLARAAALAAGPLQLLDRIFSRSRATRWQRNVGASGGHARWLGAARAVFGSAVLTYLAVPSLLVIIVSFNASDVLSFPPTGWSLRWYRSFFEGAEWLQASLLSLKIAAMSAGLALVLGTMAAYALDRWGQGLAKRLMNALVLSPMIVPPVILAIGAFTVLAQWGIVGTLTAIVLEHACIGITYVVVVVGGTLATFDHDLERAANSLGAGSLRTFARVTLPLVAPGVLAAGLFAFINSFDEVVLTSFIAGNENRTLPLKMWEDMRNQVDPTIAAVSTLLILLPVIALPFVGRRFGGATEGRREHATTALAS